MAILCTLAARCTASVMMVMLCGQGAPIIRLATRTTHTNQIVLEIIHTICQRAQLGGVPYPLLVEPPTILPAAALEW
jgi:hypothetical protein